MTSIIVGLDPDGAAVLPGQGSLFTDAQTEALRPGSTLPWNPAAARRYFTGLGTGDWHAVCRDDARSAVRWSRESRRPCRTCAWLLAIETGSTGRELALITPSGAEATAIARSGADPMLAVRVCQAILRSALDEDAAGYEPDGLGSPVIAQLLSLATAHRPVLYVSEACAEGDCPTRPPESPGTDCGCPDAAAGCGACTPHAGLWAGEWEGTPLPGLLVPAPCSVLTVLAARYDIPVRYPGPGSSAPAN